MSKIFAVFRTRGPGWAQARPLEEQEEWQSHAAFMDRLFAEKFVLLAGPLETLSEALMIVRAESAKEIEARLAEDCWTRSGLLSTRLIAPWELRLGSLG